MAKQKPWMPP